MALKVLTKVNGRLRFLYRQGKYLNKRLRRMLCNTIIQPHFDYASSAWYPNLSVGLKKKLQIDQNKYVPYCLYLGNREGIRYKHFTCDFSQFGLWLLLFNIQYFYLNPSFICKNI